MTPVTYITQKVRTAGKAEDGGKKGVKLLVGDIHGKGDKRGGYSYSGSTGIELFTNPHFLPPATSALMFAPPVAECYYPTQNDATTKKNRKAFKCICRDICMYRGGSCVEWTHCATIEKGDKNGRKESMGKI